MSDLISREAALEIVMKYCPDDDGSCTRANVDLREMLDEIEAIPTVDAVEVVRCNDCAFYIPWGNEGKICGRVGAYYGKTKPDDFCSRGVRMDLEVVE